MQIRGRKTWKPAARGTSITGPANTRGATRISGLDPGAHKPHCGLCAERRISGRSQPTRSNGFFPEDGSPGGRAGWDSATHTARQGHRWRSGRRCFEMTPIQRAMTREYGDAVDITAEWRAMNAAQRQAACAAGLHVETGRKYGQVLGCLSQSARWDRMRRKVKGITPDRHPPRDGGAQ